MLKITLMLQTQILAPFWPTFVFIVYLVHITRDNLMLYVNKANFENKVHIRRAFRLSNFSTVSV